MTAAAPLVSVVTPVHNTAKYLRECMESVLGQTYPNLEYVVLDNRSTDGSLEIAREVAQRDRRVRVAETDRLLSQPANYNAALRLTSTAAGFCKLVQADDWIFPNCLEEMVRVGVSDPNVAIVGAYRLVGREIRCAGLPIPGFADRYSNVSGSEACRAFLLHNQDYFGSQTSVMYRADLVRRRDPFYVENSPFEDTELCHEVLADGRFGFVHQVLTYSRVEETSFVAGIRRFDPGHRLGRYLVVRKHGGLHLRPDELESILARALDDIYEVLASQTMRRPPSGFWEYFATGLATVNEQIDRRRVARTRARQLVRMLGNPVGTVRWLVKKRPGPTAGGALEGSPP